MGYTEVQPVVCQLCNCPKTFGIITNINVVSLKSAYLHNLGKYRHMVVRVDREVIPFFNRNRIVNIHRVMYSGTRHKRSILRNPKSHSESVRVCLLYTSDAADDA